MKKSLKNLFYKQIATDIQARFLYQIRTSPDSLGLLKDHALEQCIPCEIKNHLALHRASNSGSYDLAVGLIKNGADVNAKTDDGWIPLHSGNAFALLNVALNSAENYENSL